MKTKDQGLKRSAKQIFCKFHHQLEPGCYLTAIKKFRRADSQRAEDI